MTKLNLRFVALVLSVGPTIWAAGKLQVPSNGVYLGIWANQALAPSPEKAAEIREGPAPNGINRTFALHLIYYQWGDIAAQLDSNGVFHPDASLLGDISHGRVPVISWHCDQTGTNSDHVVAAEDPAEDAIITASARALAQYPGPVLLRWFWEFNLLTSQNSVANQACLGNGGNAPKAQVYSDFIGAWQHIWRLFQAAGATNVSFLWNPGHYGADTDSADPHPYYPGNQFVDWIGTDSYQRTATSTFADDIGLFYSDFSQGQYGGKPLMVGENGAADSATYGMETQQSYLQGVLADLQANKYPLLKAYDYFDSDGTVTKTSGNWALDTAGLAEMAVLGASPMFNPPAVLTPGTLENGATYLAGGLVPGSWALVKGTQLGNVTRTWGDADFAGLGGRLPTSLSGVQVKVNDVAAAIYYVDSGQINFQVPDGISGTASVQVLNNGIASNVVTAAASTGSPGIFAVIANGINYAAGVFLDGKYVGDPGVSPLFRKAKPGDVIQLYVTGLVTTPAGVLPAAQMVTDVTVTIGTVTISPDFAGLVAVGEFQVNFTIPQSFATQPAADYPISIAVNGVSSPASINSSPPGPVVVPIQPH